jgi:hypothetical protein
MAIKEHYEPICSEAFLLVCTTIRKFCSVRRSCSMNIAVRKIAHREAVYGNNRVLRGHSLLQLINEQNLTTSKEIQYIIRTSYTHSFKIYFSQVRATLQYYTSSRELLWAQSFRKINTYYSEFCESFYKSRSERGLWISELHSRWNVLHPSADWMLPATTSSPARLLRSVSELGSEKLSFFMCRLARSGWEARIVRLPYSAKCSC